MSSIVIRVKGHANRMIGRQDAYLPNSLIRCERRTKKYRRDLSPCKGPLLAIANGVGALTTKLGPWENENHNRLSPNGLKQFSRGQAVPWNMAPGEFNLTTFSRVASLCQAGVRMSTIFILETLP